MPFRNLRFTISILQGNSNLVFASVSLGRPSFIMPIISFRIVTVILTNPLIPPDDGLTAIIAYTN
jgi:hypothetical protein